MLDGLRTVALSILGSALVGAIFGLLLGALTEDYLLWIGIMAALGAGFGVALGYGFLPES